MASLVTLLPLHQIMFFPTHFISSPRMYCYWIVCKFEGGIVRKSIAFANYYSFQIIQRQNVRAFWCSTAAYLLKFQVLFTCKFFQMLLTCHRALLSKQCQLWEDTLYVSATLTIGKKEHPNIRKVLKTM